MQVKLHPFTRRDQIVPLFRLLRALTGCGLKEAKDRIDAGQVICVDIPRYMTEDQVRAAISREFSHDLVIEVLPDLVKRITLRQAIDKAALVLLDMMMTNTACSTADTAVYIHACSLDGMETEAVFLADQRIEIAEDGNAPVTDIDGNEYTLSFFIPLKG